MGIVMQKSVIKTEAFINLRVINGNFNKSRGKKLLKIRGGSNERFFLNMGSLTERN